MCVKFERSILSTIHGVFQSERELQDKIESVLKDRGVEYIREFILSPNDRPDFMLNGIAIEVKVDGSIGAIIRQLSRYAKDARVKEIHVVTTKKRHKSMLPPTIEGKPVFVYVAHGGF